MIFFTVSSSRFAPSRGLWGVCYHSWTRCASIRPCRSFQAAYSHQLHGGVGCTPSSTPAALSSSQTWSIINPTQRALRLKKFNPDWSREIFNPYAWNVQSRLEAFNLDWKFQSRLKISIPTLIIPPQKGALLCGSLEMFNSVQTRCIVKGEAQKSPLFWRFSGGFWFSQDRLFSRNSTRNPLNLIKSLIFTNAPCKTACLYNAPSMHTVEMFNLDWKFQSEIGRLNISIPERNLEFFSIFRPSGYASFKAIFGKRTEYCFESTVSGERTHWVLRQTRWVLRKTRWVRFNTQIIGWEELTEFAPRNSVSPEKLTEFGVWNRTPRNRIRPVSEFWWALHGRLIFYHYCPKDPAVLKILRRVHLLRMLNFYRTMITIAAHLVRTPFPGNYRHFSLREGSAAE